MSYFKEAVYDVYLHGNLVAQEVPIENVCKMIGRSKWYIPNMEQNGYVTKEGYSIKRVITEENVYVEKRMSDTKWMREWSEKWDAARKPFLERRKYVRP